ncbi:hypothetical protein D3C73_985820 [compost metagenome]
MIAMRLPSFRASSRSWLTNTMVLLSLRCSSSSSSCKPWRISGSSAENGSSISRMSASIASARARPTRCCMPPDSSSGFLLRHWVRPTSSSFSSTSFLRSFSGRPCISRPKLMFSRTVSQGIRANFWNTMAIRLVRIIFSSAGVHEAMLICLPSCSTNSLPRLTVLRPLMQRSRLDLPDPDKPISTQISPFSTSRLAFSTPTICPVFFRISLRVKP